jgi:hypothetical protein
VTVPLPLPWASVSKLPRSPTWRFASVGAPCVFPCGLTLGGWYQRYPSCGLDGGRLTVRSGRGAAVGVVTELVDVHSTLGTGVVAGDVPCDGGGGRLVGLLEGNGTGDLRVASNECNYRRPTSSAGGALESAHRGVFASSGRENMLSPSPLAGKLGVAG